MAQISSRKIAPVAAALALLGAGPALSGHTGVSGVAGYPVFVPPLVQQPPAAAPAPGPQLTTAESVAQAIANANAVCGQLGAAYMIDCLAERLDQIGRRIAPGGGLEDARSVLTDSARQLQALAAANADRSLPRGRVRQGDQVVSSRAITPVDQARVSELGQQAAAIMERAETVLLRSASGSAERRQQYQRVAAVVGSTKVLLRST